ncbi:hypothetical protein PR202_gb09753 [Eleusine coracana subsp. coracana]|uniref:Uncharacterized protein n=1 Tax=Eleusine coracana subsp. coracana TaxID=191504 RepID=A0AAV5EHV5_ELECO|nr:hypothetical protein PR202_gb09753 [Eleusine coracana subsp. coracana]
MSRPNYSCFPMVWMRSSQPSAASPAIGDDRSPRLLPRAARGRRPLAPPCVSSPRPRSARRQACSAPPSLSCSSRVQTKGREPVNSPPPPHSRRRRRDAAFGPPSRQYPPAS